MIKSQSQDQTPGLGFFPLYQWISNFQEGLLNHKLLGATCTVSDSVLV